MLIIICNLEIDLIRSKALQQVERACRGSIAKDLAVQLADPSFTDWTLICEDERIPCHRFMLGSRSPVFKAMFEQDGFKESKTCETQIKVHCT